MLQLFKVASVSGPCLCAVQQGRNADSYINLNFGGESQVFILVDPGLNLPKARKALSILSRTASSILMEGVMMLQR